MRLQVATCQFPVTADVRRNHDYIVRQMRSAAGRGAKVAHFSECALSGYAGAEYASFRGFGWELLRECTSEIMSVAQELKIWVVLGSCHQLSGKHKPHNSLYIIDNRGKLVDRYDKRFCTGDRTARGGDLKHYSPGNHFSVFEIGGIKCGALICHDMRYGELYREYCRKGVRMMFHSYHNSWPGAVRKFNLHGMIVPPISQTFAANNYMWISANNNARRSKWASFFVRPDGLITGKLANDRAGVLLGTVDTSAKIGDASRYWRDRAIRGVYNSGELVRDRRSDCRRSL